MFRLMALVEIGSDSSECRMTTRGNKDNFTAQDTKGDYSLKNEEHGELLDSFPGDNYIDAWKTDRFSGRYHVATPTSRDLYSPYVRTSINFSPGSIETLRHGQMRIVIKLAT